MRFYVLLRKKSDETRTTISPRVCIAFLTETVALQCGMSAVFSKQNGKIIY